MGFVLHVRHCAFAVTRPECRFSIAAAIRFKAAGLAEINFASSSARPVAAPSPCDVDFGF